MLARFFKLKYKDSKYTQTKDVVTYKYNTVRQKGQQWEVRGVVLASAAQSFCLWRLDL